MWQLCLLQITSVTEIQILTGNLLKQKMDNSTIIVSLYMFWEIYQKMILVNHDCLLTLKAPITTAAEDKFGEIFPNFGKK